MASSKTGKSNKSRAGSGGGAKRRSAAGGSRLSPTSGATSALSIGAALAALGAAAYGLFRYLRRPGDAGHVPSDLLGDERPGPEDRAPEAFRPDPTAAVPQAERDALRPALAGAPAPRMVDGQAEQVEAANGRTN